MMKIFENKRIVLGVTGSIAAYKSVYLASRLTQAGALVDVVLTEAAARLVRPISFSSVTGRQVFLDEDLWQPSEHVLHIDLGESNHAFLIAPATANTIAKLAQGISDNLLTVSALASRTDLLIAPAMDGGMFQHPATQVNLQLLRDRGVTVLGPAVGHLASGLSGKGRMLEPEVLFGSLRVHLGKNGPLAGRKVLVTAGGTREPIDPVRVITNRSSGKQGCALAQAALDLGARVVLISTPVSAVVPVGAEWIKVETAEEMLSAVMDNLSGTDVLIMAAAVADYRPLAPQKDKIKKGSEETRSLDLQRTPDILQAVAGEKSAGRADLAVTIGFAAETRQLETYAKAKLTEKKLDLLVANDISQPEAGFETDTNRVTLFWKDGRQEALPLLPKPKVAERIAAEAAKMLPTEGPPGDRPG